MKSGRLLLSPQLLIIDAEIALLGARISLFAMALAILLIDVDIIGAPTIVNCEPSD